MKSTTEERAGGRRVPTLGWLGVASMILVGAYLASVVSAEQPAGEAEPAGEAALAEVLSDVVSEGEALYDIYCETCHGKEGRGDGPLSAELGTTPSDLRRLRAEDEWFPFSEVYLTIDGRKRVMAHEERSMPVWGFVFQVRGMDLDQEKEVRGRILELVFYLDSIQDAGPVLSSSGELP